MKTQVARNWRLARTELQVSLQRGETLDTPGVNWLASTSSDLLLRVDYDPGKAHSKKLQLAYDITGLTALKRRLSKEWSREGYYTVLEGIERVCAVGAGAPRFIERTLFDVDHIYLTAEGEPRFVYVPLDGSTYDASANSPLLVLAALSGRRMRFDSAAGSADAEHLRRFVLGKEVFSPNAFREFLDDEFAELRQAARTGRGTWGQDDGATAARQSSRLDALFAGFDQRRASAPGEGEE